MINAIKPYSLQQTQCHSGKFQPAFQGKISVINKYVQPMDSKHISLLEKLTEFFSGVSEMLRTQQKNLLTQSKCLEVSNIAEPIPEAKIRLSENRWITISPKKFRTDENKRIDLCHFEVHTPPQKQNFDIVTSEGISSPQKGDIFVYNYHRADKHPIRNSEVHEVNRFFNRYSSDIQNIIKKYQKKLS